MIGCPLAAFPVGIDLASKALAAFDLMARDSGLVGREKARLSLAFHRVGQAEIGAVAGPSILRAGASRFAAFNEALRDGTPAQGDRFGQRKRDGGGGVRQGNYLTALHAVRTERKISLSATEAIFLTYTPLAG